LLAGVFLCEGGIRVPHVKSDGGTESLVAKDGVVLRALRMRPATSNGRCVLKLHGIGDSKENGVGLAQLFLRSGYTGLLPDSRGHGDSGGEFVPYGLLEADDTRRWAARLAPECPAGVFGYGASLGGAILIQAVAEPSPIRAAVAEAPFANFR